MSYDVKYNSDGHSLDGVVAASDYEKRADKLVSSEQTDAISSGIVIGSDERANRQIGVKSDNKQIVGLKNKGLSKDNKIKADPQSQENIDFDISEKNNSNMANNQRRRVLNKNMISQLPGIAASVLGQSEEFDELGKANDKAQEVKGVIQNVKRVKKWRSNRKGNRSQIVRNTKNTNIDYKYQKQTGQAWQNSERLRLYRAGVKHASRASASSAASSATAGGGATAGATGGVAAAGTSGATGSGAAAGTVAAVGGGTVTGVTVGPILLVILLVMVSIVIIVCFVMMLTTILSHKPDTGGLSGVEKEIAEALMNNGYDKIHTAAIMGNMSCESSFNPKILQEGGERDNLSGEERTNWQGYGLNQFTNGRKDALCLMAEIENVDHCNIKAQVDYFCCPAEKSESNWNKSLFRTYNTVPISRTRWENTHDDLDLLTTTLMAFWERPNSDPSINHIEKRKSEAWRIYNALNSSGDGTIAGEAQAIADDDTHGYSQDNRTLNPDVDCSSFVYYSLQRAGYTAGSYPFNTDGMHDALCGAGFSEMAYSGLGSLQSGDVLWRDGHTEIYKGEGQSVGAHDDYDGKAGDSTGTEVCAGNADQGWQLVYRAPGK